MVKNIKKIIPTNSADYPGSDQFIITAPIKSFTANSLGIYNLSGNVAEMVLEGWSTKGGSWNSTGYEVRIDAPEPYAGINTPSPYIDFRILMIVEEK